MKFFICKNCGFHDLSSSENWVVKRNKKDDAEIECPNCGRKNMLVMKLEVTEIKKRVYLADEACSTQRVVPEEETDDENKKQKKRIGLQKGERCLISGNCEGHCSTCIAEGSDIVDDPNNLVRIKGSNIAYV